MLHVYDIIVRGLEGGQQNLNTPFLIFFDPLAATDTRPDIVFGFSNTVRNL